MFCDILQYKETIRNEICYRSATNRHRCLRASQIKMFEQVQSPNSMTYELNHHMTDEKSLVILSSKVTNPL